jgi:HK97 family phage prohead protease
MTEIEFRAAQVAEVSYPKRVIELVVMPYEVEAQVGYRGRLITEICSRGAYTGVEERTSRIKVNLDHDRARTLGRTVALHPSREEGLVAEIKLTRLEEGERALVMADEGILDASAGFGLLMDKQTGRVKQGAEVWETRDRRRLNHLFLDHIALTSSPAYEGARVLAVRRQEPERELAAEAPLLTPNRDRLEIEQWRARLALLDRRYGV